ncbi:helix-turn-helix domain-containing protein [Frankia sp. AvcI1]|uniref:helix-turn-helix domain-containing protein n=1 Tax=Frankia sp. AvcI1 TaxID=573496 RepID=UPI0035B29A6A
MEPGDVREAQGFDRGGRRMRPRPVQPEPAPPPVPSFAEGLWTTADVANLCRVSEGCVKHWRFSRTGPPYAKVGRHVRYLPDDVRAWLADQWNCDPEGMDS